MLTTSKTAAQKCHDNSVARWDKIILSRLIPAFGISLAVALIVGFTSPVVMLALAATTLPVVKVLATHAFATFQGNRALPQDKCIQKDLIEP
ncbi:MAG: hypothetical protein HC768_16475 [Acaryochloris sp. CRU_2_0]|nr:hypothetical protein [Acaryochloris sp. CRU_2_0]